jgi:hypothetical protein
MKKNYWNVVVISQAAATPPELCQRLQDASQRRSGPGSKYFDVEASRQQRGGNRVPKLVAG